MKASDDNTCDAARICLKKDDVTDAGLIDPACVVDHENVARIGSVRHFYENVNAANVSYGSGPAAARHRSRERSYLGGCDANGDTCSQATVSQMRTGEVLQFFHG